MSQTILWLTLLPLLYAQPTLLPPIAPRQAHDTTHFNETLQDFYYYFSNKQDPRVIDYVAQENNYTASVFDETKDLAAQMADEMSWHQPEGQTLSFQNGETSYSLENRGQDYPVWVSNSPSSTNNIVLDENQLVSESNSSFFRLGRFAPSPQNNYLVYTIDRAGNERYSLYVKNLTSDTVLNEIIEDVFYSVVWISETEFLYNKLTYLPVQPLQIWKHSLGTSPSADTLVFEEEDPTFALYLTMSNDKKVIQATSSGSITNKQHYISVEDFNSGLSFKEAFPMVVGEKTYLYPNSNCGYFLSNAADQQNFFLGVGPLSNVSANSVVLIPHNTSEFLESLLITQGYVSIFKLINAVPFIDVIPFSNQTLSNGCPNLELESRVTLEFPFDTNVFSLSTPSEQDGLVDYSTYSLPYLEVKYESFLQPATTFRYNFETKQLDQYYEVSTPNFRPQLYQQTRIFVPTVGTSDTIPVSICYKKQLVTPNEPSPLLLYGYGSYGAIVMPDWSPERLSLLDRGVVFAIAHIRGGMMRGGEWYKHGRLMEKKNTFNDMITVAKYFVQNNWTTPDQLALQGASAGGLLMGAVMTHTQNTSELFKVIYAQVPFVDVINTMSNASYPFTIQEYYEWGNPANETQYQYIKSYDPYYNIINTSYPNLLLTSGWNDNRVNYWEPLKFIAKLRYTTGGNNETKFLIHTLNAGHGGSSGSNYFTDQASHYAFILSKIGYTPVIQYSWNMVALTSLVALLFIGGFVFWLKGTSDKTKKYTEIAHTE